MEEDTVSWVEREHAVRLPKQSMGYLAYSAVLHVLAVDSLDAVDLYAWSPQDRRLKFIHTLSYHDHRTLCDRMAFSDAQPQLLFVTDVLGHCVHAWDVIDKRHVGFVIPPGSIDEHPNGIASNRDLVAITVSLVSSFVRIVKGSGTCTWTVLQDIRLPWNLCRGLRFSGDGQSLVVATAAGLACIKWCSAELLPSLPLLDVQEAHGGWLALDASGLVRHICAGGGTCTPYRNEVMVPQLRTLAVVGGLGLGVVTNDDGREGRRLVFVDSSHAVAMDAMSAVKTQWMVAVLRVAHA